MSSDEAGLSPNDRRLVRVEPVEERVGECARPNMQWHLSLAWALSLAWDIVEGPSGLAAKFVKR